MPRPKMGSEVSNSCAVVRQKKMLLLLRSDENSQGVGKYEFTGGKSEGPNLDEEIRREVLEETGYKIRLCQHLGWRYSHDVSGRRVRATSNLTLFWLARIETGRLKLSSEHDQAIWCSYKEALALGDDLSPRTADFLKFYKSALKNFGVAMN